MRRPAAAGLLLLFGGCAYFNGVYNAREAERQADRQMRKGKEGEAAGSFRTAATKAETVLVRHPKSRWRDDALYIAGRGHAHSGQCDQAVPRLTAYLSLPSLPTRRRDRATLALAACSFQLGRYQETVTLLDSLTNRPKDRELREQASLWAARAAIRLGRTADAQRYLGAVDAGSAQWELATASIATGEYERAESLLVLRAAQGDYRDELHPVLKELWGAGRKEQVQRIVSRYQRAGGAAAEKARLHLLTADLLIAAGRDSAARQHLAAVPRVSTDTLLRKEAASRVTVLNVAGLGALPLVEAAVARGAETARGVPAQVRLEDNLLLIKLLEVRRDMTGASLFLAAEVARDSLRSRSLAHALFKRIETDLPTALLAPKALLAASELQPDSAEVYRARIRRNYARSPFRLLLDGGDPGAAPAYRQADGVLRDAWDLASKSLRDSILVRRPPANGATATANAAGAANGGNRAGGAGAGLAADSLADTSLAFPTTPPPTPPPPPTEPPPTPPPLAARAAEPWAP